MDQTAEYGPRYASLLEREQQPADPNEVISIVGFSSTAPEFLRFKEMGVDAETLNRGRLTRQQLLDAGYVFLNRIGGGEKPLLASVIPVNGSDADMAAKVLLTQEELGAVMEYQKQNPEQFGTAGVEREALRHDMLAFLSEVDIEQAQLGRKSVDALEAALKKIEEDPKFSAEDRDILGRFLEQKMQSQDWVWEKDYFLQECMSGLNLAMVRGVPISVYPTRHSALHQAPSPFLDSGFHFDTNYDVTLYPNMEDTVKTRRLNMAVIHLLSRGFNEMGSSLNNSHDQRYITSGEYARDVFPNRPSLERAGELPTIPTEAIDIVALRLLVRACIHFDLPWEGRWETHK